MRKPDRYISGSVLFFLLLFTGLLTGPSTAVQAKAPLKGIILERLFDHEEIMLLNIVNDEFGDEVQDNEHPDLYCKRSIPKRRYYIPVNSQQSTYTSRFIQIQHNQELYIPVQENKTGVYQQRQSFLPAYYTFLFRYTPF